MYAQCRKGLVKIPKRGISAIIRFAVMSGKQRHALEGTLKCDEPLVHLRSTHTVVGVP